jgi:ABC-type transporter MlaC component
MKVGGHVSVSKKTGKKILGTFEKNVPLKERAQYLNAAGGNVRVAYRAWLSDYTDRNIAVTKFMNDKSNVSIPETRSLYRK